MISMRISLSILLVLVLAAFSNAKLLQFERDVHINMVIKDFHPAVFFMMDNNETVY